MSAETRVRYKIPGSITSPYLEAALEHSMKKIDLSEEALVQAIKNIKAHQMLTGEEVALKPTHLYMVPYPDETIEEFERRVVVAKNLLEKP